MNIAVVTTMMISCAAAARLHEQPCLGMGGHCVSQSTCRGLLHSNKCPSQAGHIKCCVPKNEAPCARTSGTCIYSDHTCQGTFQSNLCPTQPANVRCCVPGGAGAAQNAGADHVCANPTRFLGVDNIEEPGFECAVAGQCVALPKRCVPAVGPTRGWRRGIKVRDNCANIAYGTLLATFCGTNNRYTGSNGHAAIFISCQADGVRVIDQWCGHLPQYRTMRYRGDGDCSNDGNELYTIRN